MQEILKAKLHSYIIQNNPDLLVSLQEEGTVGSYIEDKLATTNAFYEQLLAESIPAYLIEERCMEVLTRDLKPSRFNYLSGVFEEEFEDDYYRFKESGLLIYEIINLINICRPVFESMGFTTENEDSQHLRYTIIGAIKEYLENKQ